MWHYPCHSVSVMKAIFYVFAFKIRNCNSIWKQSRSTYYHMLKPCAANEITQKKIKNDTEIYKFQDQDVNLSHFFKCQNEL